ncbi:TerC family protein [Pontibacillus halophilus]|uniref:TerC family protein n=1 Tax=Pontibacillus halophilus TaxID=516704 RepID=UPI0003F6BA4C|nr:TerC family protein [Pontibacillus halophilus]
MEILQNIIDTYARFFDWAMWGEVLSDPRSWALIGTLVILEGLLSADNALVLAVMVKHLPKEQQKKALFYGLLGAYLFRFLAIGVGTYLIKFWWVKVFGAGYLAWLAVKFFIDYFGKKDEDEEEAVGISNKNLAVRLFGTFWGTIVMVELVDIAFSVDSILAALGISEQIWVLILGGMLGVLMMRGVAGVFLKLLEKVPELEVTAHVIIAFIAAKMGLSIAHVHISHTAFFIFIIGAFVVTFIVHYMRRGGRSNAETAASKD